MAVPSDAGITKNARQGKKSRTGCQTCKLKRLKCDETKPECQNCIKRGLSCPGYKQVLKWSNKYEVFNSQEGPTQPQCHPLVEYQFSSIDPASFGETAGGVDLPQHNDAGTAGQEWKKEDSPQQRVNFSKTPEDAYSQDEASRADSASRRASIESASYWSDQYNGGPMHQGFEESSTSNQAQTVAHQRQSSSSSDTQTAEWKQLLRSYYRIQGPTLSRGLQNEATALVEHYFRDVCVLFSAFDSALNPFRTVIARLWDNSSSIFFAIQSMSAAHLANYMPNMKVTGLAMQRKAYECLQHELKLANIDRAMDDKLLLTVLLLGLTACWHDPSDLGSAHLAAARALIHPRLLCDAGPSSAENSRNDQFFAEALIYWEMVMSFVSTENFSPGSQRRVYKDTGKEPNKASAKRLFPHPWAGISPRGMMLFAEVGRLVRYHCTSRQNDSFDTQMQNAEAVVAAATDLEDELLSLHVPSSEDLLDTQDERTSKNDFIAIAEATRCAALLEIYTVFPDILRSRLGPDSPPDITASSANPFADFEQASVLNPQPNQKAWLTSLATHVLDLLSKVPSTSGTRPQQLILLATAASELRLGSPVAASPGATKKTEYDLEVARARGFAIGRLNELASRLPSKPVLKIIELVRETWRRNDAGEDVFWMDVMTANGWETVMG